jgi:hypothetical protein
VAIRSSKIRPANKSFIINGYKIVIDAKFRKKHKVFLGEELLALIDAHPLGDHICTAEIFCEGEKRDLVLFCLIYTYRDRSIYLGY